MKVFRPHLDDVENLSHGKGAKKQRGTGSRQVCHRLNRDERKRFEMAKQSYLIMRGTGYRKNRKGSPLYNIYRQRCDALEEIAIMIDQRADADTVLVDFSTLRVTDDTRFVSTIVEDILQSKYPNVFISLAEEDKIAKLLQQPIDIAKIQSLPIWGVKERILPITCDRDLAKKIAKDILDVSSKFVLLNTDFEPVKKPSNADETTNEEEIEHEVLEDEIDWNDI